MSLENAPTVTEIWHGNQIQTRQWNAAGRHIVKMPCQVQPRDQTRLARGLHSLHIGLDWDLERDHLWGPSAVNGVSACAAQMAKGEESAKRGKYYWDFRDKLSTDEGLLLKGPSLVIPAALRGNYLQHLHEGHLSASKTVLNARQHMFWPGIEADIKDYTRRYQVCIKRSRPAREPLQPHEIPDGPWQKLGMDFFDLKGKCYILICDYFSKSPFMFSCKTSWSSLKDCLIDLFSKEGFPKEIISDNDSPFNSEEFADYLSSHSVKHSTSSPHYPQSNGFIERHIQTVKNLLYKAMDAGTQSFQEVPSELRATKIGNDLPSPAEILHGRSLITGEPVTVDHAKVKAVLVGRQIKDSQQYNKSHRVKSQRALVLKRKVVGYWYK